MKFNNILILNYFNFLYFDKNFIYLKKKICDFLAANPFFGYAQLFNGEKKELRELFS